MYVCFIYKRIWSKSFNYSLFSFPTQIFESNNERISMSKLNIFIYLVLNICSTFSNTELNVFLFCTQNYKRIYTVNKQFSLKFNVLSNPETYLYLCNAACGKNINNLSQQCICKYFEQIKRFSTTRPLSTIKDPTVVMLGLTGRQAAIRLSD